jgi:hypothetical protein
VPTNAAASPTYDIVIPTIGRRSLHTLIDALDSMSGPPPQHVVIVDDRTSPTPALEVAGDDEHRPGDRRWSGHRTGRGAQRRLAAMHRTVDRLPRRRRRARRRVAPRAVPTWQPSDRGPARSPRRSRSRCRPIAARPTPNGVSPDWRPHGASPPTSPYAAMPSSRSAGSTSGSGAPTARTPTSPCGSSTVAGRSPTAAAAPSTRPARGRGRPA